MLGSLGGGRLVRGVGVVLSVLMTTMIVVRGQGSQPSPTAAAPAFAPPPAPVQPIPYSHKTVSYTHLTLPTIYSV